MPYIIFTRSSFYVYIFHLILSQCVGARRVWLCAWPTLKKSLYNDESMIVQIIFLGYILWN